MYEMLLATKKHLGKGQEINLFGCISPFDNMSVPFFDDTVSYVALFCAFGQENHCLSCV